MVLHCSCPPHLPGQLGVPTHGGHHLVEGAAQTNLPTAQVPPDQELAQGHRISVRPYGLHLDCWSGHSRRRKAGSSCLHLYYGCGLTRVLHLCRISSGS